MVELLAYSLLGGVSGVWVMVFALMYRQGKVYVAEPNRYIRAFELAMLATICGFAVWCFVRWVRRG